MNDEDYEKKIDEEFDAQEHALDELKLSSRRSRKLWKQLIKSALEKRKTINT